MDTIVSAHRTFHKCKLCPSVSRKMATYYLLFKEINIKLLMEILVSHLLFSNLTLGWILNRCLQFESLFQFFDSRWGLWCEYVKLLQKAALANVFGAWLNIIFFFFF